MKKKRVLTYLTPNERAALDEFVRRLRTKYADQVVLVRLFGSKARGDFGAESDVDVLVVMKGDDRWLYWNAIVDTTADILLDYDVVISALILDENNVHWLAQNHAPILGSITREGSDLWTSQRGPQSRPA
jgi:predicted nucleotidyltransferase